MDVRGERILIFGDSLTHHGDDNGPEIWDVDIGSDRVTSAPGDLLASILLEQGATAVRTDANVGRSAHNFWAGTSKHQFNSAADLIASDQTFAPTKVLVMLGTNDADSNAIDPGAMQQIRDTYANMGAEVWGIGPPIFADASLNDKAAHVYSVMSDVFGDQLIDARPLSSTDNRAGDGIHFQPSSAQVLALGLANALTTASPAIPWLKVALGVGLAGLLGFFLWRRHKTGQLFGDPEHRLPRHQARERIPAYFVDPNSGDVIEVDQRTAKYRREGETEFRGASSMLKTIAKESRSPEEYARRAEAWASSESKPPSIITLTTAYRGAKPHKIARLLREARENREYGSRQRFRSFIDQPTEDED